MLHYSSEKIFPWPLEEQLLDLALQIALEHTFVDKIYLTKIIIMLFFLYSTSVLHYDTIPTTQVQVTGQFWLPWRELCFTGLHYSLEPMWPCCPGGAHRLNKTPWDLAPRVGNRFAVNLGKSNWDLLVGELFFSESFLRGIWSAFKVKWFYLWVTVQYWDVGVLQSTHKMS